ncbi:MAG TPA: tetratricopeptide repeat protein, partial [Pyrinomonadaceae bacterium]
TAKRLLENAEVAILKALTLDPDLAEGHFARGLILWTKQKGFPHEQAIRSYHRSLELDPTDDETHHQLSMVYSHIGLADEAQASVSRALDLNPNNTMARFRAGVYSAYQGRFDDAISVFKTIPRDVSPMLVDRSIAEVYVQTGRLAEAETIVEHYLNEFPQDEGGSFTGVQAVLLAKAGRFSEAEDAIARAVEIGKSYGHFHHTAHNIASAYAAMEKPGDAVNWLEAAADDGFPNLPYFEIDPNLQSLRGDPGFQDFLSRLRPQWLKFKELALG